MNKIYSLLGLAKKSGSLKPGEMGSMEAIKKKQCKLLIIAEDASENTKKKFINLSNKYNIKIIIFGSKDEIGNSIGKEIISVVSILDSNFTKAILDLLE